MIGQQSKQSGIYVADDAQYAEDLNNFYARFDTKDFSREGENVFKQISVSGADKVIITAEEVKRQFARINIRKATGPDGIDGIVLKQCVNQLCDIYSIVFQLSMDSHVIPPVWKTSEIIPLPKKYNPTEMNDYRPVSLTSAVI